MEKLKIFGFDSDAQNLREISLSNRLQRAKLDSIYSNWIEVVRVVFLGTVFGPLVFNLYVNDHCTAIDTDVTMIKYAIDCLGFAFNIKEKIAKKSLESNIHNLATCLREHQLKLNSPRTHFTCFSKLNDQKRKNAVQKISR